MKFIGAFIKLWAFNIYILSLLSTSVIANELVKPTESLEGTQITYEYTSGRKYNVKFEKEGISYQYLTGSKPDTWWGPFNYQAFEVSNNQYFVSWYEDGYGDHVTLLINFKDKILYGSALIILPDDHEIHFHGAEIIKDNHSKK
ncbi:MULTISPECIES: phenolic acid decarboxylase [Pseudomonadati]|uniref:MoaF N-terminal domain-containing protein n=1 Tax=Shewanella aestuarii TaxID=1028752 RepID=A0ABT0KWY0_9GAMM|nr:MoaF N-terminal domain-containing protein [Shewanella aestuarii]MCL1115977.1 MoaF N-terminal domain-containing protein [Shewanella aestuarii]GGN69793.1 hypothetical protein GCM10009193_04110 [Shewanella aestuarii]